MALGLSMGNGGDGGASAHCKYDARAGRMFRIDKVEGQEATPIEITQGFAAVMDLANIEVGWILFQSGVGPDRHLVKIGHPLPVRPSKEHKQGFRINMKLGKSIGGDVRELMQTAGCVIAAMDQLHSQYSAAAESKVGKLPIVTISGVTAVHAGQGAKRSTNYAPNFTITGWVDRPAELPLHPVAPAAAQSPLTPPVANVTPPVANVPPPVAVPQPAQTMNVGTEF